MTTLEEHTGPLSTLHEKIAEFASRCLPNYLCSTAKTVEDRLHFEALDLDDTTTDLTGLEISLNVGGTPHLFTEWSRGQLLTHLGTREKWFQHVDKTTQAQELGNRIHTFDTHCLRLMKTKDPRINLVRGLVSAQYAEIEDTKIMDAMVALAPQGRYVSGLSGKTDRAFYSYILGSDQPIGIPGTFWGYPGAVIKNSEVGYTSLWVIPFVYATYDNKTFTPVVLRDQVQLKRAHRGSQRALRLALDGALAKTKAVWAPLQARLTALRNTTYATEDEAVIRMRSLLGSLKLTQGNILACEHAYRRANFARHDGTTILRAVMESSVNSSLDTRYDEAEVAGALLLRLL